MNRSSRSGCCQKTLGSVDPDGAGHGALTPAAVRPELDDENRCQSSSMPSYLGLLLGGDSVASSPALTT
eukprot:2023868-Pyramimonas_sp.AAC.1